MRYQPGNQFWKLRSKHGRDRIFATPQILLEAAYEYFDWCEKHPLIDIDYRNSHQGLRKVQLPKMRAFTLEGLTCFLDVNTIYFNDFEYSLKGKTDQLSLDFSKVITHIRQICARQKFEGAAAGFLNANIIARDLGLRDNTDITSGGEKITGINYIIPKDGSDNT